CKLAVETTRLRVHGVDLVTSLLQRPLAGTPKTATISRSSRASGLSASRVRVPSPPRCPPPGSTLAVTLGGTPWPPAARARRSATRASSARRNRRWPRGNGPPASSPRGHPNAHRSGTGVARVPERLAWRRSDFPHQHRRRIVNPVELLAVADLS